MRLGDRGRPNRRRRQALRSAGVVLLLLVAYLALWPVPIDPAPWTPEPAPVREGPHAVNERLAAARRIPAGGLGPEDVAVDAAGRLYAGLEDGRIVRIAADGRVDRFAHTGGRPLGLAWDAAGNLLVADGRRGLLSVAPDGAVTVLAAGHQGVPFRFADDVDVGPDGTVYFSDASWKFGVSDYVLDFLEHRGNGRLLAFDPAERETRVLLANLYFANGVAVSGDGAFVLVVESAKYRIRRYWLTGERQGTDEVFAENLPGVPDGVSRGERGLFWVALATPRDARLDALLPRPFLRKVVARLPRFLQPGPARHGHVLALDASGRVVHDLQDPAPTSYSPITSVEAHGGDLYLGTIGRSDLATIPAPE